MKKLMVAVMVMTVMVSGATNVYASTSYSVDTATESFYQLHHQHHHQHHHRLQLLTTTRIMEQPVQQIPKQTLYQHRILQNLIQKQIQQLRLQLLTTTRIMEQPVQQIPKQTLYQHRILQNLIQKQIQQLRLRLHQETLRILQSLREVILKKIEWNIYMYPLQVPQLML